MYTVFKTNRENIIFAGSHDSQKLAKLFSHQFGYLCRREVFLKKIDKFLDIYYKTYGVGTTPTTQVVRFFSKLKQDII